MRRIDNFVKYMQLKGLTDNEVTGHAALSNGLIGKARQGKSDLGDKAIEKILTAYPDLNRVWLLTGEGKMLNNDVEVGYNDVEPMAGGKEYVPLIPTPALANSLAEYIGSGVGREECPGIISPVPGAEFAITISGDSMEPKFHDGMVVFLKKINDKAFIPWGNTLVLDTENGAYIKNVYPVAEDADVIEARSFNPLYPPLTIPKASIFGMYRVLNATKFFTTM